MKTVQSVFKKIIQSYLLQFTIIAVLVLIAFYKVFNFSFHANREIGWLMGITGQNFTLVNLIRSHGFISAFNFMVFGMNPKGWYLTAVILHILATSMLIVFTANLTKSRIIGFVTGLWFSVSLAWHDTITFGSQEGVYSAQFLIFFIAIFFYKKFREKKQKLSYLLAFLFLAITLPLRELGLIFFPILFLFDIIFFFRHDRRESFVANAKKLLRFVLPQIPFIIFALIYFILSKTYLEPPHYFADERVKLQRALLTQGHYIKYLFISAASFGTYLPPHVIPYPLLNFFRELTFMLFLYKVIKLSFFSILGYLLYIGFLLLAFKQKNTKYFKFFLFAIAIISVPTFFYSTAVSMDENMFLRDYSYDENRWRYFAFYGTSLFIVLYLYVLYEKYSKVKKRLKAKLFAIIILANLLINTIFLWNEENKMYNEMFHAQKLFYSTMQREFPSYPKYNILYAFPISYALGDYLHEWFSMRNVLYPNSGDLPKNWTYGEMEKLLMDLKEGKIQLENVYFIDFNPIDGVINKTEQMRAAIRNQRAIPLVMATVLNEGFGSWKVPEKSAHIEIPYDIKVTLRADRTFRKYPTKQVFTKDKIDALTAYTRSHMIFLNNISVTACGTRGNMLLYDKSHLNDGIFADRSTWFADCIPGVVTLDLGNTYNIAGVVMGGFYNDPQVPRAYFYEISTDNKVWKKVHEVKENTRWEMIDKWPRTYDARYVRIYITDTQKGSFAVLDEIEPVLTQASSVFSLWSERSKLAQDMYRLLSHVDESTMQTLVEQGVPGFGKLRWITNGVNYPDQQISYYFPFAIDGQYHTYTLPIYDSEHYSRHGQFLRRYINEITLDFSSFPGTVTVDSIVLRPKIPIEKK